MPRGPKPLKGHLGKEQFYCVKCRARVHGDEIKFKTTKSSKRGVIPMLKAWCHKCETRVNKFIKQSDVSAAKKEYK